MTGKIKIAGKSDVYYLLAFFFAFTFGYFYWVGNYLLFFQEQQSLFVFSADYIHDFFLKPGGILELSGKFLTQFYSNTFAGSFIIATVLTLAGILVERINRHLKLNHTFSILFLLVPSCLLLLMQTHYYHFMVFNLGFLMILTWFLLSTLPRNKYIRYFITALFPLFYYLAGAFAFIFCGIIVLYNLMNNKGGHKFIYSAVILVLAPISIFIFKEFLFLQPLDQLIFFPLPFIDNSKYKIAFYLLSGFLVSYPLLAKISLSMKQQKLNSRPVAFILSVIVFSATFLILSKFYNSQTARVAKIEKLAFEEKWDEIIKLHEIFPSQNLIGQYFYNVALSETGQLCNRLFYGNQNFNANSLILPWKNEHLSWGGYFYYSVGLINEAHRWAYEGMVVYGMRPQNLKFLVKTNLINGNYLMAEKYVSILKKTFNYKCWAKEYEKLITDPTLIKNYPDLEAKRNILPEKDFFIQIESPQNNIPLLLDANQNNKKAFEYEMAWLLLIKDVEGVVNNLYRMKELGYSKIPRHIEEAALIYSNSKGNIPDLGGLAISQETQNNFNQYVSTYKSYRQNLLTGKERMQKTFGNTFMFYFHFK